MGRATGFKRYQARNGLRCSDCMARSNHTLTRPGDRERLSLREGQTLLVLLASPCRRSVPLALIAGTTETLLVLLASPCRRSVPLALIAGTAGAIDDSH